jgi:cation diffusion facilitator CzcD-associated flavoprotein CzcO
MKLKQKVSDSLMELTGRIGGTWKIHKCECNSPKFIVAFEDLPDKRKKNNIIVLCGSCGKGVDFDGLK